LISGSEIRASTGIVNHRSRSMPIKANHYINILYYFLYLTLSISTSFEAFLTGTQGCIGVVGMSNAAKSLQEREVSQRVFYGGPQGTTGRTERCREVVGRVERGKKDGIRDEGDSRVRRE